MRTHDGLVVGAGKGPELADGARLVPGGPRERPPLPAEAAIVAILASDESAGVAERRRGP